jgi:hypothetical protein
MHDDILLTNHHVVEDDSKLLEQLHSIDLLV